VTTGEVKECLIGVTLDEICREEALQERIKFIRTNGGK
jgi:hypothetical protein